jgi:sugar-specific transcriptional regulator TrmB
MRHHADNRSTLQTIGISEFEEDAYRFLLEHSGSTLREVAEGLSLSQRKAQRFLVSLEKKGMATHSPERVRRYFGAPPDIVIDALIARRQHEVDNELRNARLALVELRAMTSAVDVDRGSDERIVEILSREAATQVHAQMMRSAKGEILCLERLPTLIATPSDRPDDMQLQNMARGVRYFSVVDDSILNVPGTLDRLHNATAAGESYRSLPTLPFKLVIVDRRVGFIPLNLSRPDGAVLLVRASALLDALSVIFDILWEQAAPITFSGARALKIGDPASAVSKEIEQVLPLLAAGLNDKGVAHQLDISVRTLERRILGLMEGLGARTRFQAGWLAALRLKPSIAAKRETTKPRLKR